MRVDSLRRSFLLFLLAAGLAVPSIATSVQAAEITVFAAASLKNALDDAAKAYEAKTGDKVVRNYAASSALAKQIESGAHADIFFSADLAIADIFGQPLGMPSGNDKTDRSSTLGGPAFRSQRILFLPYECSWPTAFSKHLMTERLGSCA